ncbi:hypothetical protein TA3x_001390 [Tundrisphaera sp. TA3]|uniref:hypothetical protein n=1 Tax=Tundrisphaera sp. TA3 TaxID=3435775 RepID=UPI003EBB07CC
MLRRFRRLALPAFGLALLLPLAAAPAFGQAKDPIEGFFDIPVDPNAVEEPSYGVPAYLITSGLGGLAIFIVCKSARRQ